MDADTDSKSNESADAPRHVAVSPAMIWGWFVRFFLLLNAVSAWVGYALLYGQWPGAIKLGLCTGMGAFSVVWLVAGRSPNLRSIAPRHVTRVVNSTGAVGIVVLVLAEGLFLMWLIG